MKKLIFVCMMLVVLASMVFAQTVPTPAPAAEVGKVFGIDQGILLAVAGALWAISEVLSFIPAIKANGVFQLIVNIIGTLLGKKTGI